MRTMTRMQDWLIESGDGIVGSTAKSRRKARELRERIKELEQT